MVNESNRKNIDQIVCKALNALDIKYGASHTELILTDTGELFIVEVGARMGGDFIGSHLVELSGGYNFLSGLINVALGRFEKPEFKKNTASGIYFLTHQNQQKISSFFLNNKSLIEWETSSSKTSKLTQSADRIGYFIYNADKKIDLP